MKKIVLILPYFGKWPLWFDAFLLSVAKNPSIHWLCPTDCELPQFYPDNIIYKKTSIQELNLQINAKLGIEVPLSARKLCDLRPAYGHIFQEFIQSYDFWGFCDMDIIWGDIRKFITNAVLDNYDIISSRKQAMSGHFSLIRNTSEFRELYKIIPNYLDFLKLPNLIRMDEELLTMFLKNCNSKTSTPKIYWDKILCNQERGRDSHQEYYLDRWFWDNGRMINTQTGEEIMYLHFINWKRTMKRSEVSYSDQPDRFYISYSKMHYNKHSDFKKTIISLKNLVWGYYQYEKYELLKRKYKKRIIRKLNNLSK